VRRIDLHPELQNDFWHGAGIGRAASSSFADAKTLEAINNDRAKPLLLAAMRHTIGA